MSWMSPLTVPITTLPTDSAPVSARSGRRIAIPAFIALAASSTSGTNRMPSRKSTPTMRIPSTSASLSVRWGDQPRSSRIRVPWSISSAMPSYRSSCICSTSSSSGRVARSRSSSVMGFSSPVGRWHLDQPWTENELSRLSVRLREKNARSNSRAGVGALHADRLGLVVVAVLDRDDQLGHGVRGERRVLELVARRADRDVEAVEVRAVVDRDPVVSDVVDADDPERVVGDPQGRDPPGQPERLALPTGPA